MYHHVKKLMYTVTIGEPDPKFGRMLLEQFGGANGELAAAMQYSIQGFNCEDAARKDLLMDIGTEELSHLEVVGALIRMHLKPMKSEREAAEADPLVAIAGGGGVALFDSMGNAWTADYLKVTGDLAVDLRSNIAAEARAKIVYERLISFTAGPGHEGSSAIPHDPRNHPHARLHRRARQHGEAAVRRRHHSAHPRPRRPVLQRLDRRKPVRRNRLRRPMEQLQRPDTVESEIKGGEGLDVTPYDPQPGTEVTSPIDSTPVGQWTNGVGKKQAALHDKAQQQAEKEATVEV